MFFDFIIFLPLITAFFVSFLVTPLCIKIIKKFNLLDDPRVRIHPAIIHQKPTPRAGGVPLFIGVLVASLIFLPVNKTTLGIFGASFISLVLGVLDDKFDISPYIRFVVNIITAVIVVAVGVSIPFITNPFGGILFLNAIQIPFLTNFTSYFSFIAVVIWIVWVMNMLNWSKGVDGQMPGVVAISAIVIGILSFRFADPDSLIAAKLAFIIAGSSLGFLIFNFYPARIFPGYSATSIYLLLSVVSILSSAKLATAILVMGVPMMDGVFTVIRRILSGRSPFWHDKKHLHHLLLSIGISQRYIALFYWLFSAILGALALVLNSRGKLFTILMLLIIVFGGILFLQYLVKKTNGKVSI